MKIEVDRLMEAGESFAHQYRQNELSLEDDYAQLREGASVSGRAIRKGDKVRLTGHISASVDARCSRCARPVAVPVELDFDAPYVSSEKEEMLIENKELQENDLDLSFYEGDSVDVDELVREQVLLALPTRLLCREDCKGLCSVCGADLNEETCTCEKKEIDPRWSALAAALKQKE